MNSHRLKTLFVLVIWFCLLPQTLYAQQKIAVEVDYTSSDNIGPRLAYQIKEHVRKSTGLRLTNSNEPRLILYIVSAAISELASAVGYTITIRGQSRPEEIYLISGVVVCGTNRIAEVSELIMSNIDKQADYFRK
jgi:hypothetical protein